MTPDPAAVDRTDWTVNRLGASLFFDATVLGTAADLGVADPVVLYAGGRAGVMGDVTAAQVRSAFGFFAPDAVAEVWPTVLAVAPPSHLADVFVAALAAGARARWDRAAAATVADLGRVVVDGVTPLGLPLFAGWQAVDPPPEPHGAALVVVMALRELRGDVHLQEVASAGLQPLEAEVIGRGPVGAELHGWKPPFPDAEPLREPMAAVEAATSRRMARHHGALDPERWAALAGAVAALDPAVA